MKISMIIGIPSLIILPVFPLFAADGTFEGEISVSGLLSDVDGNKAKFNEYRHFTDGVYSGSWVKYDSEKYFIKGLASDVGYDTQKYEVEGGKYGSFKAYFDFYEIPHNLTFGANAFYSGVGTNNLTFTSPIPPVSSWKNFDYATMRRTYEGGFSFDQLKPFFFELSIPHEEKTGSIPMGVAAGTTVSPGSSIVELPQSVNYTTNSVNLTSGYVKNPFFAAVSFMYSEFKNSDSAQYFDRLTGSPLGRTSTPDAYSLPPGNDAYKLAFKGSAKLPYNSQFSMNVAKGGAKSDDNILLATTNTFGPIFRGDVDTNNYDFVLITNPVRFLKAKIDYKYNDRKNNSDVITSSDGVTNDLFGYRKNKIGVDLDWRLPAKFNLDTAYSNVNTVREFRDDLPKNNDNIFSTELKWRGLSFLTPKIRYERLQRTADHGDFAASDVEAYVWRYDAAPKDQNTIKASVDINPIANLNFTAGYKYVDVDYSETILGLKSTQSNQVNLDAGYTIGKIAKLNAYFDVELKKDYQVQRSFVGTPDPSSQNSTNFNWDLTLKDNSYSWGGGTEIYLLPDDRLTLLLQYDNINSDGNADFAYLFTPALTGRLNNDNIDIANWDDYRLVFYSAKIRYKPAKQYTFIAGYAYEQYRYNDAQLDNYLQIQGSNYLSGAYANPNYDAHVVFVEAIYKF